MSTRTFANRCRGRLTAAGSVVVLICSVLVHASVLEVRHPEGSLHGFLILHTLAGRHIADGDLIQTVDGGQVTVRLLFHFRDGSVHDETTVFSQRGRFRLLSDHLVQKGPTFPTPLEMSIDAEAGLITMSYTDDHGEQQRSSEHKDLPADLANGMILTLLKNVSDDAPPESFSFVAASTPAPRLVTLKITSEGAEAFRIGDDTRRARRYVLAADLGGLTGLIAPLIGKQPPDSRVWILPGAAPAFVKAEQPLYVGGPLWRIELVSPVWSEAAGGATQ